MMFCIDSAASVTLPVGWTVVAACGGGRKNFATAFDTIAWACRISGGGAGLVLMALVKSTEFILLLAWRGGRVC